MIDLEDIPPPSAPGAKTNTVFDPFGSPQMKAAQPAAAQVPTQQGHSSSLLGDFNSISFGNSMPQQMMLNDMQMSMNQSMQQQRPLTMGMNGNFGGQQMNMAMINNSMPVNRNLQANLPLALSSTIPANAPVKQASPFDDLLSSMPISKPPQQPISSSPPKPVQQQSQDLLGFLGK